MYRKDCRGSGTGGCIDEFRTQAERLFLDVDKARPRTFVQDAVGRSEEAKWGRDDLGSVGDLERPDDEMQSRRPTAARYTEASAGDLRDAFLEGVREGPKARTPLARTCSRSRSQSTVGQAGYGGSFPPRTHYCEYRAVALSKVSGRVWSDEDAFF